MNRIFFAGGTLAILATACSKPADDDCPSGENCTETDEDTDESGEGDDTGESGNTGDSTDSGDTGDTGDCPEFSGAFSIGIDTAACSVPENAPDWDIHWDCSPDTNAYWFEIYTIGWADTIELYIEQNSAKPWNEYHNSNDMIGRGDSYESYDYDGYWDYYYLYMQHSSDYREVQDDPTKTLYGCDEGRISTLSFFFVANSDSDSSVDCVAWGSDPGTFDTSGCSAPDWI